MTKLTIVARMTGSDGKEYIGKREVKMYDENTKVDTDVISHANQGLTLQVQRQIREALKVKYGLKAVSTAGESKNLSDIESV